LAVSERWAASGVESRTCQEEAGCGGLIRFVKLADICYRRGLALTQMVAFRKDEEIQLAPVKPVFFKSGLNRGSERSGS
jgi:hypothetical protein